MTILLCVIGGYLAGSIPFAVVVSRLLGLPDPRSYGSKNIGATNVLRSGNRLAALATMLGDAMKGWAAVLLARFAGVGEELVALTGFMAFLGHLFPVWLRFRGGKGVATAGGVLIAFDWRIGMAAIVAWLLVVMATRYSSAGALTAAVVAPTAAWFIAGPGPVFACVAAMALLLVAKHHANIAKLARGEESRIGAGKTDKPAEEALP